MRIRLLQYRWTKKKLKTEIVCHFVGSSLSLGSTKMSSNIIFKFNMSLCLTIFVSFQGFYLAWHWSLCLCLCIVYQWKPFKFNIFYCNLIFNYDGNINYWLFCLAHIITCLKFFELFMWMTSYISWFRASNFTLFLFSMNHEPRKTVYSAEIHFSASNSKRSYIIATTMTTNAKINSLKLFMFNETLFSWTEYCTIGPTQRKRTYGYSMVNFVFGLRKSNCPPCRKFIPSI